LSIPAIALADAKFFKRFIRRNPPAFLIYGNSEKGAHSPLPQSSIPVKNLGRETAVRGLSEVTWKNGDPDGVPFYHSRVAYAIRSRPYF
jgi:hypothetical protein